MNKSKGEIKMTDKNIPAAALQKLLDLSSAREYLSERVISTEQGIQQARMRLTGNFTRDSEFEDTRSALDQMLVDLPVLQKKLRIAESTYENCKSWLDSLPAGTMLEPVEVKAKGDLEFVRARIDLTKTELRQLRGLPTSAADIREKVENYVSSLGRPTITGIGAGEHLKVVWPGAGWDSNGERTGRAEPLALFAALFPSQIADYLMKQIDRMQGDVVPFAQRAASIASREAELEQLAFVEEALIERALANGEDVTRSSSALPQAVLGIRIAEKSSRAA
jgi:hypothetical protein